MKIKVRLQPRASQSGIVGWEGGALKVRVNAPPVDGAANLALIETLSRAFGLAKSKFSISAGLSSRNKVVEISGADSDMERKIKSYDGT